MKQNRGEKLEVAKVIKKQNEKAERSRSNVQTSSTNSDFNHSNEMVNTRGA